MSITQAMERDAFRFDPFGTEFREDPERFHADLFAHSPGFMSMEGVPSAYVATHAQCCSVLRDFKTFSSAKPAGLPGMERIDFFNGLPVMNYSDPPDHTRRRKVVNPAFTPRRTEALIEGTSARADAVLDRITVDRSEFEVLGEFAKPLVAETLLSDFMQIAPDDHSIFIDYVATLPLLDRLRPGDPKPPEYLAAWERGREFCRRQQELARQGQCDNLVGLIADSAEGGAIDDNEMMAMMIVLLIGGVGTVAGALGATMLTLAGVPGAVERILQEPDAASRHLEETLRLHPPVSLVMRFATADADVGGKLISAGTPVYALIATACHDPDVFADPYEFDIDRPNLKDHIAFGYGMHTCIGNSITRNLVPMLLRKIADRFPRLRLAGDDGGIVWDTSTPRARHVGRLVVSFR